jgi:RNA polymerase sigma factor (TIGR02999 family)
MDRTDLDAMYSVMYEELRGLASRARRDFPGSSLSPTTVVNEAYMRLVASLRIQPESHRHFRRLAARAMRQVLVDAARRRSAARRGGGWPHVVFDDSLDVPEASLSEVVRLDEVLTSLAEVHPRPAATMECRFFGGYSVKETAEVLGVSEATVHRDWRLARAWLSAELNR